MVNRRRYLDLGAGRGPIDITSMADLYPAASSEPPTIDFEEWMRLLKELAQDPPVPVAAHIAADVARAMEAVRKAGAPHLDAVTTSTTFMGLVIQEHPDWPPGRVRFLMSDGSWLDAEWV